MNFWNICKWFSYFSIQQKKACVLCILHRKQLCQLTSWDVALKNIPLILPTQLNFPKSLSFQLPLKTDVKIFADYIIKSGKHLFVFSLSHLLKNTVKSDFFKASPRCPRISANLHLLLSSVSLTPLPVSAESHTTI